jgi:hypothetical protein
MPVGMGVELPLGEQHHVIAAEWSFRTSASWSPLKGTGINDRNSHAADQSVA